MPPLLRARRSHLPSALTAADHEFRRRIRRVLLVLSAALVAGTAGYMLIDDAINIVVTLTARSLNPDLDIVARAIQPEVEDKLRRAGATHVISPYRIGASASSASCSTRESPTSSTSSCTAAISSSGSRRSRSTARRGRGCGHRPRHARPARRGPPGGRFPRQC
jgi:hypothetical protein